MGTEDGIVWFLRASERDLGSVIVLVLEGRVSHATTADLAQWLAPRDGRAIRALIVDLSGVDYMNGAALQVFETAARRLASINAEMVLCALRPVIRTIFDLAGPLPHLTIESSSEIALHRLGHPERA